VHEKKAAGEEPIEEKPCAYLGRFAVPAKAQTCISAEQPRIPYRALGKGHFGTVCTYMFRSRRKRDAGSQEKLNISGVFSSDLYSIGTDNP
jgi:hypothetical protein